MIFCSTRTAALVSVVVTVCIAQQLFSVRFNAYTDGPNARSQEQYNAQLSSNLNIYFNPNNFSSTSVTLTFQNFTRVCNPECTPSAIFFFVGAWAGQYQAQMAAANMKSLAADVGVNALSIGGSLFGSVADGGSGDEKLNVLILGLSLGCVAMIIAFAATFFCLKRCGGDSTDSKARRLNEEDDKPADLYA